MRFQRLLAFARYGFEPTLAPCAQPLRWYIYAGETATEVFDHVMYLFTALPATAGGARINRYFYFLVSQKKFFLQGFGIQSFFLYNFWVKELVRRAVLGLVHALSNQKRVIFIADKQANSEFNFLALNYLFWPRKFYTMFAQVGQLHFYYNKNPRFIFYEYPNFKRGFDFALVCASDYSRLKPRVLRGIARVTAGVCSSNTRPDFFDYSIPTVAHYRLTVAWMCALVLLLAATNKSF